MCLLEHVQYIEIWPKNNEMMYLWYMLANLNKQSVKMCEKELWIHWQYLFSPPDASFILVPDGAVEQYSISSCMPGLKANPKY